jgi:delta8-fatty-acid desaturase
MGRAADRILSRRQVEGLIAEGKTIIILDNDVLRVDAWLKFHPGGDKAILHMVGRDATDEINAYVFLNHLRAPKLYILIFE